MQRALQAGWCGAVLQPWEVAVLAIAFLPRVLAQYKSERRISYCAALQETSGVRVNLKGQFSRAGCNYI